MASNQQVPQDVEATHNIQMLFARFGPQYRWWATITSIVGHFPTLMTGTIISIAIPSVMGALSMTVEEAQWLATGYLAASTICMLLAAWAIECYGMRNTFVGAMMIFAGGSVLGGFSTSGEQLMLARIIQGVGAGLMAPASMVILFQVFPKNRRGTAMGIYSIGMVFGAACGPVFGGWLIDNLGWRYVFFMALPFAMASIPLATLFLPEREPDAGSPTFDWTGVALLSVAITSFLTMTADGNLHGWGSDRIAGLAFIWVVTTVAFLYWEAYVKYPMFKLSLFLNVRFLVACLLAFVLGAGMYASIFLVPIFLQLVQGLSATDAGLLLLPATLVIGVMFPVMGRISDFVAPRKMIVLGLLVFAIHAALFGSVDHNTPFITMVVWLVIGRIGLACIIPSLTAAAVRPLSLALLADGIGTFNFIRQIGAAFGVTFMTVYLQQRTSVHVDALNTAQSAANTEVYALFHRLMPIYEQLGAATETRDGFGIGGYHLLLSVINSQGSMLAFRDVFVAVALIAVVCVIPALLMDNRKPDEAD